MIQQILVSILISLVAILCLILFIIGLLSYKRARDTRLLSITLAFGIFFVKNLITAIGYQFKIIAHGDLELFGALFDLIAMLLLVMPIFKKPNQLKVE